MTARCFARCAILLALLGAPLLSAQQQPADVEKLGNVHFPVSCSADAQRQFDRALAMLHSFWYPQGIEAFTSITTAEPACAMAYWGIAIENGDAPVGNLRQVRREAAEVK